MILWIEIDKKQSRYLFSRFAFWDKRNEFLKRRAMIKLINDISENIENNSWKTQKIMIKFVTIVLWICLKSV